MRHLLTSSLIAASFALAAPAFANGSSKFETSIVAPLQQAVKIEVVLSEDMAHRADNLPEKISDRGSSRGLNSGFSSNGFYGERELEQLTERFEKRMAERLAKVGIQVDENASTVLRVTLEDAKPNRPTFGQLSKQPNLSYKSFSTGGAEVSGELIAAGGQSLGTMSYAWYETNIRDASFGGTWSDANRAFGRFARQAAKTLTN